MTNTFITIDQVHEQYGFSKSYIYKACMSRKLKHFKRGRLYFDRKDLEQYIRDAEVKTISAVKAEALNSLKTSKQQP